MGKVFLLAGAAPSSPPFPSFPFPRSLLQGMIAATNDSRIVTVEIKILRGTPLSEKQRPWPRCLVAVLPRMADGCHCCNCKSTISNQHIANTRRNTQPALLNADCCFVVLDINLPSYFERTHLSEMHYPIDTADDLRGHRSRETLTCPRGRSVRSTCMMFLLVHTKLLPLHFYPCHDRQPAWIANKGPQAESCFYFNLLTTASTPSNPNS